MRRITVFISLVVVAFLGGLALPTQPAAIAQEATPAGEEWMPEGTTFESVTFATGADFIGLTDLVVIRLALDPGAGFSIEEDDPSVGILLVESGTFTVQVEGSMTVTRGEGMSEAMAAVEETGDISTLIESITAGEAVTLEAGDAAYIPGNVTGEIRNDGQERAVALGFLVVPPEEMTGEATPAP